MSSNTEETPLEVNKRRLAEAEEAMHQLQLGLQARVFVDQNGERIEYTAANRTQLRSYIERLRFICDPSSQSRPLRVVQRPRGDRFSDIFPGFVRRR